MKNKFNHHIAKAASLGEGRAPVGAALQHLVTAATADGPAWWSDCGSVVRWVWTQTLALELTHWELMGKLPDCSEP